MSNFWILMTKKIKNNFLFYVIIKQMFNKNINMINF